MGGCGHLGHGCEDGLNGGAGDGDLRKRKGGIGKGGGGVSEGIRTRLSQDGVKSKSGDRNLREEQGCGIRQVQVLVVTGDGDLRKEKGGAGGLQTEGAVSQAR